LLLLLLALPAAAQTTGVAPHRFQRPYGADPLDQEKARVYQDQLRREVPRGLSPDPSEAARERELRRELDRVDRVLRRRPRPEPPERAREPDLGPVVSSGGHPQPTQAEIEEKLRDRRQRVADQLDLRPVYDLFGERLQ
jgi:hypothetical protein